MHLALKIIKAADKNLQPELVPYKNSDRRASRDIKKRIPCLDKAKQLLNYNPQFSLDMGIKRMVGFYKKEDSRNVKKNSL